MTKPKKCIFPVAGCGTRFLPITSAIPKEMLPILNKPLIHYAVEEAIDSEITNFGLIINKDKQPIRDYFSSSLNYCSKFTQSNYELQELNNLIEKSEFSFIEQKEMLGLGHAISMAEKFLDKEESFVVILPDDLCVGKNLTVTKQLIQISNEYPSHCIIAIEEIPIEDTKKYGIISGDSLDDNNNLFHVKKLVEKPERFDSPSNLAIIGRYVLTKEIFPALKMIHADSKGEIQLTDALNILAMQGKVIALKFNGFRYDTGSVKGFIKANCVFAKDLGIII